MNTNAFVNLVGSIAMLADDNVTEIKYGAKKDRNWHGEDILVDHKVNIIFADGKNIEVLVDVDNLLGTAISILEKARGW